MKILHVVPFYKPAYIYGGPIASVSKLCETEQAVGAEIKVLTTNANGKTEKLKVDPSGFSIIDNVEIYYFDSATNDNTFISVALWKYLYTHCKEYDIIHIHTWWNFLVLGATFICKLRKVQVVLSPRGMLSDYIFNSTNSKVKKSLHRIFGKSLLKTTTFNATSTQEYEECEKLIKGWRGFVLPNIIDLPEIEIVKTDNPVFTLSFLSRIDPKKGLEFVFEAISILEFPVKLRIAGKGEAGYISQLKSLALNLGIEHSIEWVGWKDQREKFDELMSADIFVLASYNENFANVVIEALYTGTPVLISKYVGLADYIVENDLGWVTDLNGAEIAGIIKEAYEHTDKLSSIRANAHRIIVDSFSPHILAAQYLDEYRNVLTFKN